MPQLLDFSTSTGLSRILSGPLAMLKNDGVEIDNMDLAYTIQGTDTSAKGSTGAMFAEVTLQTAVTLPPYTQNSSRMPQLSHSITRDLFYVGANGTQTGVKISRYNTAGVLQNSLVLDATATIAVDPQIGQLPNGNIVVSWLMAGVLTFTVLDRFLSVAPTILTGETVNVAGPPLATFSMGITTAGFVFTYIKTATATHRMDIRNQDGTVAVAAFTIMAWTGAAGNVFSTVRQQSDGNLFVGFGSKYATTVGTYYGIFTLAGATVVATTLLEATTVSTPQIVEVAVLTGFMALATARAANNKVWVFNNAGVQQGATFTHATTSVASVGLSKLVADTVNNQFILIDMVNGTAALVLSGISTAGVSSTINSTITTTSTTGVLIDAVVDRTRLLIGHSQSTYGLISIFAYAVFNLYRNAVEANTTTYGTSSPNGATGNGAISVVASGDFTFSSFTWLVDTIGALEKVLGNCIKYSPTAVIGSLFTALAANTQGYAKSGGGSVTINQIGGAATATFDGTAGSPHGNKGSISLFGMSLVGMG